MNKIIILITIMITLIISGCNKEDKLSEQSYAQLEQESKSVKDNTEITEDILPTASSHKEDVILSSNNYNITIYPFTLSRNVRFQLFSKEELKLEDVKLEIDINTPYEYEIVENEFENEEFQYYLYQCYRNNNWNKMFELYEQSQIAQNNLDSNSNLSSEDKKNLIKTMTECDSYSDLFKEDYEIICNNPKYIPDVHAYNIYIKFPFIENGNDESFETIKIITPNNVSNYHIGEVKINYSYDEIFNSNNGIENKCLAISSYYSQPWGDIKLNMKDLMQFTALKDVTLKRLYFLEEEDVTIEDINLSITNDKNTLSTKWNSGENYNIYKGESVSVIFNMVDEKLSEAEYGALKYLVLEYECEGETNYIHVELDLIRDRLCYEAYAQYIDGINVKSYYVDYYNKAKMLLEKQ